MKSMSLGRPHLTRSSSSLLVSVGRSTTTPGRLTFLRSLCARAARSAARARAASARGAHARGTAGGARRARAPGAAVWHCKHTAAACRMLCCRSRAARRPSRRAGSVSVRMSGAKRAARAGRRAAGPGGRTPASRCSGTCSAPCPPSRWWRAPPARWSRLRTGSASPAARPPPASCSCAACRLFQRVAPGGLSASHRGLHARQSAMEQQGAPERAQVAPREPRTSSR